MSKHVALALILCLPVNLGAEHQQLAEFSATYDVRAFIAKGEVVVSLRAAPGVQTYIYRSEARPMGFAKLVVPDAIIDTSHFQLNADVVIPIRYQHDDGTRRGKDNKTTEFDWEQNIAVTLADGQQHVVQLEPKVTDVLGLQIAVMIDMANGRLREGYTVVDKNVLKTYEYVALGQETVTTPAGTFETECYRSSREGSERTSVICVAPELAYLPVRMEQQRKGKTQVSMMLSAVTGLSPGAAFD